MAGGLGEAAAGEAGGPTFVLWQINWRNNWGARQTAQSSVPAQETKASKLLAVKICGGCGTGENSVSQESPLEGHRGP